MSNRNGRNEDDQIIENHRLPPRQRNEAESDNESLRREHRLPRAEERAEGSYFLMPNVSSVGDDRPVAVRLRTGTTVVWDGRFIRHCSSVPNVGKGNTVYGDFLGASSPVGDNVRK